MIDWPPVKAWTSIQEIKGYRHFVAINYGEQNDFLWANLVSVIDGDLILRVSFEILNDSSIWLPGWHDFICDDEHTKQIKIELDDACTFQNSCLHPSHDSGFTFACEKDQVRPWFPRLK